jgi:hypothetical protein
MASHFNRTVWNRTEQYGPGQRRTKQDGVAGPLTFNNYLNWKLDLKREVLLAWAF